MRKRTTIELDQELLVRAQRALGLTTMRATVEEALRRAAMQAEGERDRRADDQRAYLASLEDLADRDVLLGDEMWR